jgi:iron complex transport system substrate-binding protein
LKRFEEDFVRKSVVILVLLVLTILPGLLTACNEPVSDFTFVDDLGRPVRIESTPERIISLGPSITEIIFALDLGDKLVGVTDYCDYPEEAKSIEKVGSPFPGFNMERIVALEPDLVVSVAGLIVQQLEQVGVTVVVIQPRDINGIYSDIQLVGQLSDRGDKAEKLVASLRKRVDAVIAKTSVVAGKPTVFYEVDGSWNANNPWTTGYSTFQDDLINLAGGTNIAAGRSGWYEMSIEEILNTDPDLIVLEDYQYGVTPDSIAGRVGWSSLTAVKEGRVYPIEDPNVTCRYGPRIVDGLEMLARAIHPELFSEGE